MNATQPATATPAAFLGQRGGFARVCCYHGQTRPEMHAASEEATAFALAQGWRVSHGICEACGKRELEKMRRPRP